MKLQETYVDTWETCKRKNRINTADMAAAGYTYTFQTPVDPAGVKQQG